MDNEYEDLADVESVTDSELFSPVQSPQFNNKRKCNSTSGITRKPRKQAGTITAAVKELRDLNKILSAPHPCNSTAAVIVEDECEIMGKQIAVQLRMMPEHMRLKANFEIQRILMDFRMDHLKSKCTVSDDGMSSSDNNSTFTIISLPSTSETTDQLDQPTTVFKEINSDLLKNALTSTGLQFVLSDQDDS